MNLESTSGDRIPFADPEAMFAGFTKDDLIEIACVAGDFMLAIDENGVIQDIAVNLRDHGFARQWIGQKWADTVTIEGQTKIEQLLEDRGDPATAWRQVSHLHDGEYIPVNYRLIRPEHGGQSIAVGRDLRPIHALQQRLLRTQQSMERDYLHLRQTETRFRLLFDNMSYPVMIADADDLVIQQANSACYRLFGMAPGSLEGKSILGLIESHHRDDVVAYVAAVAVNTATAPLSVRLPDRTGFVKIAASPFRQAGRQFWLINIDDGLHEVPAKQSDRHVLDVVEQMPDAFVLTDERQSIIVANQAFAELVHAASVEQLLGAPLGQFLGRAEVDLNLLKKQLKDYQIVRNFGSFINDLGGGSEPVEISAILIERDQPLFGYSLRSVARRERDLPGTGMEYPRSVEQLTELVGRKPLKEIVRESTDLIERMCIEAALIHTADNRASAAEILGLSRQSLYSKLHRHGLGNLTGRE